MPVTKTCAWCGKSYRVKPSHVERSRFCSLACRVAEHSHDSEARICGICGKHYTVPAHKIRQNWGRVCSRTCDGIARQMTIAKLKANVDITPDGHHLWQGRLDANGYPRSVMKYQDIHVHREILRDKLAQQGIPLGDQVARHTCRYRHCIRAEHLEPGTQQQNKADELRDGTRRSKLDETDIPAILAKREAGYTLKELGDEYGVSDETIRAIVTGRTWKHVPRKRV